MPQLLSEILQINTSFLFSVDLVLSHLLLFDYITASPFISMWSKFSILAQRIEFMNIYNNDFG